MVCTFGNKGQIFVYISLLFVLVTSFINSGDYDSQVVYYVYYLKGLQLQ